MRCSICGAQLKKDGDICNKCYKEYKEEVTVSKDSEEVLNLKRKYLPKYQLTQCIDFYVIFALVVLTFLAAGNIVNAIISIIILILGLGTYLYINKLVARGTQYTFFKTKVKSNKDYLFIHKEKILKNSEITDMGYYQTRRQKWFGLGDIRLYTKSNFLLNGMELRNVPDVLENFEKLKEILNLKENEN